MQADPPYIPAILTLASNYEKDNDPSTALRLYLIGAERGEPKCCENAARIYESGGRGVKRDDARAKEVRGWKGSGSESYKRGGARR